jgi:ribA/ribD-fused uncharacterized protein
MSLFKTIDNFRGGNAFLSNFHPIPVLYQGIVYPSSENAYQAAKTDCMETRKEFVSMTAGQAKRAGRKLTLRQDWEDVSISIMREILRTKFQDHHMATKLMGTEDILLVEGNNWHDNFWGDCNCEKCQRIVAKNVLGLLLMEIRTDVFNTYGDVDAR